MLHKEAVNYGRRLPFCYYSFTADVHRHCSQTLFLHHDHRCSQQLFTDTVHKHNFFIMTLVVHSRCSQTLFLHHDHRCSQQMFTDTVHIHSFFIMIIVVHSSCSQTLFIETVSHHDHRCSQQLLTDTFHRLCLFIMIEYLCISDLPNGHHWMLLPSRPPPESSSFAPWSSIQELGDPAVGSTSKAASVCIQNAMPQMGLHAI